MGKSVWTKGLVIAIIMLFIGTSIIPNMLTIPVKADDTSIVLFPTDDCLIKHDNPDFNYGSSTFYEVRNEYGRDGSSGWAWDSLIKFDVSSIPSGSYISSANLKLYYCDHYTTNPKGRPLNLYRANSTWNEGKVTWNTQPSYAFSPTTYSFVPDSFEYMTWDVTNDVRDFVNGLKTNYGWKITDETYWGQGNIPETVFHPKEYSDSNYWPKLEIKIDQTPPEVWIVVPEYGHTYFNKGKWDFGPFSNLQKWGIVTICGGIDAYVHAEDNESGINRVEFYVKNEFKANGIWVTPNTYEFKWFETRLGSFLLPLTAKAYDNAGNNATASMLITFFWDIEI